MDAGKTIQYLEQQEAAILELIGQLDEIQVGFNARFDEFKASHDQTLDKLVDVVAARINGGPPDTIHPALRAAIKEQVPEERAAIEERRQKVREEYLPQRQAAADELLGKAQAEMAQLRALNPQLDEREEGLKAQKADLEGQITDLNELVRLKSRGLGVIRHFFTITKADRERHRVLGKLEGINDSLYELRRIWEEEQKKAANTQAAYQDQWQLESVAVARLQSELDQLDDETRREDLAQRRAIRHVLDALKEPAPSSDPELNTGLQEMIELNIQTDSYHKGLASVGGMIGLLRGIDSGMKAIRKSIEGLRSEQQMHSAYLKALDFDLPGPVELFHRKWPILAERFSDQESLGTHPVDFSAAVQPLLEGPLSQAKIEAMFNDLGTMIERATAGW